MNNHTPIRHSPNYSSSAPLLDDEEKTLSDLESDTALFDLDPNVKRRFRLDKIQILPVSVKINFNLNVHLTPRHVRAAFLRVLFFLLPSFVQSWLRPAPAPSSSSSPSPSEGGGGNIHIRGTGSGTAYLDGLRGLAAFFVFLCHFAYTCFVIAPGWGYQGDRSLLKLPFLRLFYSGPPMVCVFFVVSGYALSARALKQMRARRLDVLAGAVSSLVFRRGMRLFVPPAVSTLLVVVLLRVGAYEWTRGFAYDKRYMRNVQEIHYERFDSTGEQVRDWARTVWEFAHVWDWDLHGGSTAMDVHLWTIPVEFRCSMVLFLSLVGTAGLKVGVRLAVVAGLAAFCYLNARWEMMLFYAGMGIAEMELAWPALSAGAGELRGKNKTGRKALWLSVSVVGLYFMSQPDQGGDETPGWVTLSELIPEWWDDKHRYWQSLGAILLVLAVGRSPAWRRVFESTVVQYLGNISYAIYLMHGPVMHTLGYAIERRLWSLTGIDGRAYNLGFVLASFPIVPVVVWVSDIFWRLVDAPVVRLAKWVERKCSVTL